MIYPIFHLSGMAIRMRLLVILHYIGKGCLLSEPFCNFWINFWLKDDQFFGYFQPYIWATWTYFKSEFQSLFYEKWMYRNSTILEPRTWILELEIEKNWMRKAQFHHKFKLAKTCKHENWKICREICVQSFTNIIFLF